MMAIMPLAINAQQLEIPCSEFHPRFNIPCMCGLNEINATRINCDKAVFTEFPVLPYRFYIQEFSQRYSGLQTLGAQLFTASDLPLTRVDFSHNSLMRLTDRLFDGVEDTLEEIEDCKIKDCMICSFDKDRDYEKYKNYQEKRN